jgi:hypothetical protein
MRAAATALIMRHGEGRNHMVELIIMAVFFGLLIAGGTAAVLAGHLPTAKELAEEDTARFARYKRALER